uniref:UspA domain-containing protein n=1 Tax=Aegilops tauschii TaxID=37682 RepID=N1QQ33_AEGTA
MCPVGGPGSAVYGAPAIMQSVRAARKESARSLLDRAKRVCHTRGVCESRHRAFQGSVSDYCAHHASCPVMVVPPPPVDKDGNHDSINNKATPEIRCGNWLNCMSINQQLNYRNCSQPLKETEAEEPF